MIKVFISYSHDTPEHKEFVLALSERLRRDGIETSLDRYVSGTPPQKWPRWMLDQVGWADFVLLVCSETYYRRFRGHEVPGKGKGADWEGAIITQEIYDSRSATTKFVPVMFAPDNEQFIPEPVRGHTFYVLNSEANYQDLHDFLLGQAGIEPGPVGKLKKKELRHAAPLTFGNTGTTGQHYPQISPTRLTHGAERLFGRENELAALESAWDNAKIHVMTVVAFGGAGKTSLIFEWMNRRAAANWPGMARVFDWSFYSMGTREQGDASSDSFIKAALIFFGDRELAESAASAWDKGGRLAALVAERPTLLVLDGLEPLQYPPGQQTGKLKDPAVETLLKGLARQNPGLCVVTTRESIADLAPFQNTTATELLLHRLSTPAGAELLKQLGVRGSDAEFNKLVEDVKGHALTLNLLGRFLAEAHGGDIRRRDMVDLQDADEEIQGGHAFRVIEAYEKWFASENKEGRRLLAVLNVLALFDRPADYACIEALRKPPAIPGLTVTLVDQGKGKWNITLSRLQKCGLISLSSAPISPAGDVWGSGASLDTHPIIREYFAGQLRKQHLTAWETGHRRLYEHLTKSTYDKRQPSLEDLMPLYQAVFHGCQGGLHDETLRKVYQGRILRGREFYSSKKLCAYGANLGAVACFFEEPWERVSAAIPVRDHGWLLNEAAMQLEALGRMLESLTPMQVGLVMAVKQEQWNDATSAASNLCSIELALGDINHALDNAVRAVEFADKVPNLWQPFVTSRVTLADGLRKAGQRANATNLFRQAESKQIVSQPNHTLYGLQGFRYCEALFAELELILPRALYNAIKSSSSTLTIPEAMIETYDGVLSEIEQRAVKSLKVVSMNNWLPYIPLDKLTLGRVYLFRAALGKGQEKEANIQKAREHLTESLDGLHLAGRAVFLPLGFLSRAWLRFMEGDEPGARDDLDEAWEIAERGPMRLNMTDILLYRARLFCDREALGQARTLIEHCGYWMRNEELEDAESMAWSWPF